MTTPTRFVLAPKRLVAAVRIVVAIVGFAGVVLVAAAGVIYGRADTSNVGTLTFENELKMPPVLAPREQDGRKAFDLRLQQGRAELLPGRPADTWGVNGAYLGPTLRASRGDEVELRVGNALSERTTIHWHGMHLPARADGGPHQPIAPGATWTPRWRIDQPAATLWYHAHPHGETADHIYRGLAGMFILDDPRAARLGLPDDYGVDDIPLIIQDKRLHEDGSLDFSQALLSPVGRLGDEIVVNGTHDPYLEVRHERVRFRLLNASNARVYNVGFVDRRPFALIASDGGLLERSKRMTRIQLSPGERAEIVAAFEPGETVVLRSFEPNLGGSVFENRFAGGADTFDLLQIRVLERLTPSADVPERLAAPPHPREADAVRTRRFELSGSTKINGREMDLTRIDAVVTRGSTEIWEVHNAAGRPHNLHIHGVHFRVIEYADRPPPPQLTGLKDTVYVPPGEAVRFAVRFSEYADRDVPYMFHCHILEHEDRGMMGQFVVVRRGETANASARHGSA